MSDKAEAWLRIPGKDLGILEALLKISRILRVTKGRLRSVAVMHLDRDELVVDHQERIRRITCSSSMRPSQKQHEGVACACCATNLDECYGTPANIFIGR
jgi:hypothetical protein